MMFRLNALFEAWLREATERPLASWKRSALLWRLQDDEELRCYAMELAEFSHEPEAKGFGAAEQAWMLRRIMSRLDETPRARPAYGLGGMAAGLALGVAVLGLVLLLPKSPAPPAQQAAPQGEALARLTHTSTVTPTGTVTPAAEETPQPVTTPTPAI
jgi:hypothetical protein